MTNIITPEKLRLISQQDLPTLIEFDTLGLLIGPDETIHDYCNRLKQLQKNLTEFNLALDTQGYIEIFDMKFAKSDLIPEPIFSEAQKRTSTLYDFTITWIPGFFTNERMGWLFAGCALYHQDDFSALFLIRKSFQHHDKWLIYSRNELIAHELCHIAHIGFNMKNYEELFAYQTAESRFRRICGGLLRSTTDTYLLLGSAVVMMVAQFLNLAIRPPSEWRNHPMPIIYLLCLMFMLYVILRYLFYFRRYQMAHQAIASIADGRYATAVLFRCSETEIKLIAKINLRDKLIHWISCRASQSMRWKIIKEKYFHKLL